MNTTINTVVNEALNSSIAPRLSKLAGWNRQRIVFVTLVLLAVTPAIDATYMFGKAKLAQALIARSWQSGETAVKPWPWADTYPIAKITAPSVDLQAWVLAGASGHSLSFGPGLADGSVEVGKPGVVLIAGHRDTSFQPLQHVALGDSIYLQDNSGQSFNYRITDISIADARYNALSAHSSEATLVLVTCYPFNAVTAGGPMRYVVQAVLVEQATVDNSVTSGIRTSGITTRHHYNGEQRIAFRCGNGGLRVCAAEPLLQCVHHG